MKELIIFWVLICLFFILAGAMSTIGNKVVEFFI